MSETNANSGNAPAAELIPAPKFGRPTAYEARYCEDMVRYFREAPQRVTQPVKEIAEVDQRTGKGTLKREVQTVVGELPTFERFAGSIGVTRDTLMNWGKKYPEFAAAIQACKDVQRDFMMQGLAGGRIPGMGGIFVAKNLNIGMVDDQTLTVQQAPEREKPVLAERTPAQLEALKAAVLAAEAAGVRLVIEETAAGEKEPG